MFKSIAAQMGFPGVGSLERLRPRPWQYRRKSLQKRRRRRIHTRTRLSTGSASRGRVNWRLTSATQPRQAPDSTCRLETLSISKATHIHTSFARSSCESLRPKAGPLSEYQPPSLPAAGHGGCPRPFRFRQEFMGLTLLGKHSRGLEESVTNLAGTLKTGLSENVLFAPLQV